MKPEEARLKFMKQTQTSIDIAADISAKQQAKSKTYHDKGVRSIPQVHVGDHVFVDTPLSLGQTPTERSADEPQGKLRNKTTGT